MKYTTIKNIVWVQLNEIEIFQLVRYRHIDLTEFNSISILFSRMEKIASIYTYVYIDNVNVIIYWANSQDVESLQRRIKTDDNNIDSPVGFQHLNNVDILTLIQKGLLIENEVYYLSDFDSSYESFDWFTYTLDTESVRYYFDSEQLEEVLDEFYS